jgi:ATP-dependent RNA helicase SUPV3L1/SUV3
VATDAIAMGLNLPIRRVLLSALSKFDGVSQRHLTDSEIRQICGRAGRYGLAERGEAGVLQGQDPEPVKRALQSVPREPRDDRLPVMPPWPAIEAVSDAMSTDDLAAILKVATGSLLKGVTDLRAPGLDDALSVAAAVAESGLPLRIRFRYLGCPVECRDGKAMDILRQWAKEHGNGRAVPVPLIGNTDVPNDDRSLASCETAAKLLTTYLWLSLRWPECYSQHDEAYSAREKNNSLIEAALRRKRISRNCRRCGARLMGKHKFKNCEDCYLEPRN